MFPSFIAFFAQFVTCTNLDILFYVIQIQDGVDDLTTLSYMHDPAILHALYLRYRLEMIYSYAGPILIAGNHFSFGEYLALNIASNITYCLQCPPFVL